MTQYDADGNPFIGADNKIVPDPVVVSTTPIASTDVLWAVYTGVQGGSSAIVGVFRTQLEAQHLVDNAVYAAPPLWVGEIMVGLVYPAYIHMFNVRA